MEFTKMEALGNDFVVLNGLTQRLNLDPQSVRSLADRRRGVGCDQVLVAEAANDPRADVRYRIYNADGSEAEHCGNGVRCLARYLVDHGLFSGVSLRVETPGRLTTVEIGTAETIRVDMGVPELDPARIPFIAERQQNHYTLATSVGEHDIGAVSLGNPHAVLRVTDVSEAPVAELGRLLETHERFPKRVNVGFMQICARNRIRLRVFERGAGETPACGTGACAAVVVGRCRGELDAQVTVELPGGQLVIDWPGPGEPLWMTGPARSVFSGEIRLTSAH
ncbi:diaminopimelate epimerase [Halorhodospira abdelmalekii]|nr:diaminopimelate epimerase [Halorhodospira abdelmalekii]MBK1733723.1 diaminopimelate epimerase [Halorhodospira abdelmalekii]